MNKISDVFFLMERITDVVSDREGIINPMTNEWLNGVVSAYHNANYQKCLMMLEDACLKLFSEGIFEYTILDLEGEPEAVDIRALYNNCLELLKKRD
jgi:hypothetical protein